MVIQQNTIWLLNVYRLEAEATAEHCNTALEQREASKTVCLTGKMDAWRDEVFSHSLATSSVDGHRHPDKQAPLQLF